MNRIGHYAITIILLFLSIMTSFAQDRLVFGTVTDSETREPLTDVSLVSTNQKYKVKTNQQGKYELRIESGKT